MSKSEGYHEAYYSVKISREEFNMLMAFKNAIKDGKGRASDIDIQAEYLKAMDVEEGSLRNVDTETVRDILEELEVIGILHRAGWSTYPFCYYWELYAADRGCEFSMMEGDNE